MRGQRNLSLGTRYCTAKKKEWKKRPKTKSVNRKKGGSPRRTIKTKQRKRERKAGRAERDRGGNAQKVSRKNLGGGDGI